MKKYKIQNRSQKNSHSCVPLSNFDIICTEMMKITFWLLKPYSTLMLLTVCIHIIIKLALNQSYVCLGVTTYKIKNSWLVSLVKPPPSERALAKA